MNPLNNVFNEVMLIRPDRVVLPLSWVGHIPFVSWLIAVLRPSCIVELGTHTGNSYLAMCQAIQGLGLSAKCYAIDTWKGDDHAGYYGEEVYRELSAYHNNKYATFSSLIRSTFDDAVNYFADGTIDLLHIDGLHTYEAVRHDFETWLPKMSSAGIVIFHDTNVKEREFGVWKLWEELQRKYPHFEFFHSHGLGVLLVGSKANQELNSLFSLSEESAQLIRQQFSTLGEGILQRFLIAERDGQIAGLSQAVAERDGRIASLAQTAAERDGRIASLAQTVAERDGRIAQLQEDLQEQRRIIKEVLGSTSWRVSAPIRYFGRKLKLKSWFLLCARPLECWSILKGYVYLKRSPLFDSDWYLAQNPDVSAAGVDPLIHYLKRGWREGRNPGPNFDGRLYLKEYPDVAAADIAPLIHYWIHGRKEGRSTKPRSDMDSETSERSHLESSSYQSENLDKQALIQKVEKGLLISVIIPTYNRKQLLPGILEAWREVDRCTKAAYEIIFSDDGSDDGSADLLESVKDLPIRVIRNDHGGAAKARNAAIRAARGERLLIIGDDIFPDPMIINVHLGLAEKLGPTVATLGRVDWHPDLPVNHLMHHITDIGNEQFSFNRLQDESYTDFRHFYTCNVCIDRNFILEEPVIFDSCFYKYGFEDIELGYRLSRRGLKIYYTTRAVGFHYHPYSVESFCRRQQSAGEMAVVFGELHPEVGNGLLENNHIQEEYWKATYKYSESEMVVAQHRLDALVDRCSTYEDMLADFQEPSGQFLRSCLTEIYIRLFRAMYEYGVLQKLVDRPDVLAHVMHKHFSSWESYFTAILDKNGIVCPLSNDQRVAIIDALNRAVFMQSNIAQRDQASYEIAMLKTIFVTNDGRKPHTSHWGRRLIKGFYYLFNDPRYLKLRVLGMLAQSRANIREWPRNASEVSVHRALPGLIMDEAAADPSLARTFIDIFDGHAYVYVMNKDRSLRTLSALGELGDEARSVQDVEANVFYWPENAERFMHPDHLLTAYLAVVQYGLDIVVISHALDKLPTVACGVLRDQMLFSQRVFDAVLDGTFAHTAVSGKVLRLLPAPDVKTIELGSLERFLGVQTTCDVENGFFQVGGGLTAGFQVYVDRRIPAWSKKRPVIFVLPIFIAVGGVERNTIEIMRQLNDRYDFVLVTMERLHASQGSLAGQAMEVAARVIEMSEIALHRDYLDILERLKVAYQPDLIWVCNGSPWFCDNASQVRSVFHDVPIVDQMVYDIEEGWIRRYREPGIQSFDRFIAINQKIYQKFVDDFKMDPEKITLIYSAVDADKFARFRPEAMMPSELRKKFGLPEGKRIFVFMGRLTAQKRPLDFLQLAEMRRGHTDEFFVLVGDGELAGEAERFIEQHALSNVRRIPYVALTPELFSVTDGMVITSSYEGLPIAMIEALCMGVPVLATDVGDIAAILVEYKCGDVLKRAGDVAVLEKAFEVWVEKLPKQKTGLEQRAPEILERFSSKNAAQLYVKCWEKTMKSYRENVR